MVIAVISFFIVSWLAGYTLILTNKHKEKLTCMAGMMIAMTSGMMSSLVLGTILGTMSSGQMFFPTVIGVTAGMTIGYFTGKPITFMAGFDGLMAGIMGGMMGAMLGVMVNVQNPNMMILFMDVIFVIVMLLLVKLIHEEAGVVRVWAEEVQNKTKNIIANNSKSNIKNNMSGNSSRILYTVIIGLILLLGIYKLSGNMQANSSTAIARSESASQKATEAVLKEGYQEVNIAVSQFGYTPSDIKVKAGIPVKMNFQKDFKGGCVSVFVMKDFNIQQSLSVGKTTIDIKPYKPGTYAFSCGMGMYGGNLIVEASTIR